MATSVKAILYKSKRLKSGKYLLAIRVIKDRKTKYIFLGHSIHPEDWDAKERIVKPSHPNSRRLNLLVQQKAAGAESAILEYENKEKEFSLEQVKKKVKKRSTSTSFFDLAGAYLKQMELEEKYSIKSSEASRVKNFREFNKNRDVQFFEISVAMLSNFRSWLKSKGVSDKTVNNHLIMIRTLFNKAIREGIVDREYYPFGGRDKIQLKKINTLKVGLDENEIQAIRDLELEKGSSLWHAKNVFLISFNFAGVRIGDVLLLKWAEVRNGRLNYQMGKTGENVSIPIPAEAQRILNLYKENKKTWNDYVFPFVEEKATGDKRVVQRQTNNGISVINKKLKKIADLAGISKNLSTHIARHTFGNIAGDKIPIPLLQKLYRHKSLNTTAIYQGNFIHRDTDEALLKVVSF